MSISLDDLRMIISIAAFVVSCVSIYFTRVNWLQSNRPIVTAYITEHLYSEISTPFNLVVSNTGNRPAIKIQLHATKIPSLVYEDIKPERIELIKSCFAPEGEIPLLRNCEDLTTSFGAFMKTDRDGKWLRYGAEIEISLTYSDIEGRLYKSRQPLKVHKRDGFGGGTWSLSKD